MDSEEGGGLWRHYDFNVPRDEGDQTIGMSTLFEIIKIHVMDFDIEMAEASSEEEEEEEENGDDLILDHDFPELV